MRSSPKVHASRLNLGPDKLGTVALGKRIYSSAVCCSRERVRANMCTTYRRVCMYSLHDRPTTRDVVIFAERLVITLMSIDWTENGNGSLDTTLV